MAIAEQYKRTVDQVARQCVACGRNPAEVQLVAVSKTVGPDGVGQAVAAGAQVFGENRPDQILQKAALFPESHWHFIGNVQSRRIPDIVSCASLIHSVYVAHHLPKIDAAAREVGKVQRILLEVNVSGEESKSGAEPGQVPDLIRAAASLENISVCGLMTMAPQGDLKAASMCFEGLARLRDELQSNPQLNADNVELSELSMGMSEDWREAIAQGATMIRIGRAIFSEDFA